MIVRLPPSAPGLRVGLYGGSFNPAHAGHLHVSRLALRRLALDRVWWMVSPGNPLKDRRILAPLAERVAGAEAIARDPRIAVTAFETAIGARYTRESLEWLVRHRPDLRFVWIMGADSLASFHRWQGWRAIARMMPIAVIDRPGFTLRATAAPAGRALDRFRLDERHAARLVRAAPPAWVFLHGPRSDLSSTALRGAGPSIPGQGDPRPR
ncbi:nicotinate-nucleotide adenylyltransferase [Methylobacterium nodulans]|uniref:Probable nicotinate-nucleotide adenylyltransferase n=1 Tax=Methylobacterium nodulans (strain LMG 21967 / CNCM I-2342 / ORS 2060) TaxID=460265 RepID=B8IEM2_METNO|nr:nicotinate-nucleotide adenylyltransferase [Methylobacterium nodulans]ACL59594.1 nicotinate (nicotinamide) nucleotide adenylyltransferase [Methylobacterium nodulans ORS 2060]